MIMRLILGCLRIRVSVPKLLAVRRAPLSWGGPAQADATDSNNSRLAAER